MEGLQVLKFEPGSVRVDPQVQEWYQNLLQTLSSSPRSLHHR